MYDMIVIGGGPAAMAAAFFAHGKGINFVMLFEELGGKIGWRQSLAGPDSSSYLPGNELVHLLAQRTANQANLVVHDRVTRVGKQDTGFLVETVAHGALEAPVVVVATGAAPVPLEVPGAQRLFDRGLEYSASTYAHLTAGAQVAVVGGGLRALSGAAELARVAQRVYVIAPRVPGYGKDLAGVLSQHPAVEFLERAEVLEVLGEDRVTAIRIRHHGQVRVIAVERVFVALGIRPSSDIVRDIADVDDAGFILVNEAYETTMPGVFAAGDVTTRFGEQVMAAIGDGARAAQFAYHRLLAHWLTEQQEQRP